MLGERSSLLVHLKQFDTVLVLANGIGALRPYVVPKQLHIHEKQQKVSSTTPTAGSVVFSEMTL